MWGKEHIHEFWSTEFFNLAFKFMCTQFNQKWRERERAAPEQNSRLHKGQLICSTQSTFAIRHTVIIIFLCSSTFVIAEGDTHAYTMPMFYTTFTIFGVIFTFFRNFLNFNNILFSCCTVSPPYAPYHIVPFGHLLHIFLSTSPFVHHSLSFRYIFSLAEIFIQRIYRVHTIDASYALPDSVCHALFAQKWGVVCVRNAIILLLLSLGSLSLSLGLSVVYAVFQKFGILFFPIKFERRKKNR